MEGEVGALGLEEMGSRAGLMRKEREYGQRAGLEGPGAMGRLYESARK